MLDVQTNRMVRLYQCDKCGERIWEAGAHTSIGRVARLSYDY
jgi:uncharacterized protein YlaI